MRLHFTPFAFAVLLMAGCGDDASSSAVDASMGAVDAALGDGGPGEWSVDITASDLDPAVDNELLPYPIGASWRYRKEVDGEVEITEVEVLAETKDVWGTTATVVRDTVTVDGELEEDTRDWFAQDQDGNVWYLGEDTCEYEDGECVSMAGAWEAGIDGALPGIVMLAEPQIGDSYYQEFLRGEAEDQAEVVALDVSVEVEAGAFDGCVRTRDFTRLEPDVEEFKTYCLGVGLVLEEEDEERVELVEFGGL